MVRNIPEKKIMTAVYSCAHFIVDLACAFLILGYAYGGRGENILLYNFCAFALQMPAGLLADRFGYGHRAAAAGCAMIFFGYFLAFGGAGAAAAVCAGVGNALFHVGGGVYVLDSSDSSGALGIFVSPGAIGLFLGTAWANGGRISPLIPMIMIAAACTAICAAPHIMKLDDKNGAPAENALGFASDKLPAAAAAMFFAVVAIRSVGGFGAGYSWKTGFAASFAAVLATAGGKALGGFVSDRLGKGKAAAATMLGAALLYLFSDNMALGLGAILLFNMSMPITLRAAADIFEGGRGFSFGLLTFALFIGYVPFYVSPQTGIGRGGMSILCALSAALLLTGFALCGRKAQNDGCA